MQPPPAFVCKSLCLPHASGTGSTCSPALRLINNPVNHVPALRCAGRTFVAPLVEEMLARIGSEVGRYERVVTYWPVFGPLLEGAVCAALREATGAVSRQCGLAQVRRPQVGTLLSCTARGFFAPLLGKQRAMTGPVKRHGAGARLSCKSVSETQKGNEGW